LAAGPAGEAYVLPQTGLAAMRGKGEDMGEEGEGEERKGREKKGEREGEEEGDDVQLPSVSLDARNAPDIRSI